jgi:hypothetical protein
MSVKVGALLAAAEEAEERCRRYGRLAAQLVKLTFALYVPAFVATAAGLVAYMLYNAPHLAIAGLVMWIVGYVVYILSGVCSYKAVKAARQACIFRRTAESVAEIEKIRMMLEKEIDELEQELKKRDMRESSAD